MSVRFLTFFLFFLSTAALHAAPHTPFHVTDPQGPVLISPGEMATVTFTIEIPPDHFIYRDKTDVEFLNLDGLLVKKIVYPKAVVHEDPFFKKKLDVYEGDADITVTFQAPVDAPAGKRNLEAMVRLQGCSASFCYPEETRPILFNLIVPGVAIPADAGKPKPALKELLQTSDFTKIIEQRWWIALAVVFLGGFLTSLTPCVLPLIPITLLIIGVRAEHPLRRNLFLACSLVLGLALTYAGLGVAAVALGKSLGFVFQQKWFLILIALFFFALSLSMFGLYEIHLPSALRNRLHHIKGHGMLGAFLSGMAAGLLAAPCAGPVIGALLLYVATTQNYPQGFFLLLIYALGMGLLFIILGTGYAAFQDRLRGFKASVWVKRTLGVLLLLVSLFYVNSVISLDKSFSHLLKASDVVPWINSESEGLEKAKAENKVALIDFYAEWCAPCKELEYGFFRKPETMELLRKLIPIRVDATFSDEPKVEAILDKYNVVGWPTILFVDPSGHVIKDLTVISYNPELLLKNMQTAIARYSNDGKEGSHQ